MDTLEREAVQTREAVEKNRIEPIKFIAGNSIGYLRKDCFAILSSSSGGSFIIEDVGGEEVLQKGIEQGLPIENGISGLANILAEAQKAGVIKVGDKVPGTVFPELGMALMFALGRLELVGYFGELQIARRIARQEPKWVNPLLWKTPGG